MSRKRAKLSPVHEAPSHHSHGVVKHTQKNQQQDQQQQQQGHQQQQQQDQLITGLPDHIAHLCLSKLPPSLLFSVSLSWRRFLYSALCPPFLSLYAILTPTSSHYSIPHFASFDPVSSQWQWLPSPPLNLLLRHPSFISRNLPIQSVTAANRLIIVAATTQNLLPALNRPLVFNPAEPGWGFGPDLPVPRRWCAAGSVGGSVYVAGGVGTHFSRDTSRLVEKWDVAGAGGWERAENLRDGRFSREAVDAVGWREKLCVVNVDAKEGALYDTRRKEWAEMKEGMVAGWRGPAAAMAEEEVFLVDQTKAVLRKYDQERDLWVDVFECERLRGAQHVAAAGGRVCVVDGGGGGGILVVDVTEAPARVWVVEPPPGYKAVAVHVLPRMSRPPEGGRIIL